MVGLYVGLFVSHAVAIYAGWKMGSQRGHEYYVPPAPKETKSEPYQHVDELDQERLDWK